MKRLILIPLAALALTACDPDIDMAAPPTVTVTETEVVTETVEVTADPVVITRDPAKMVGPDRRQWGDKGSIGAQYLSYEVNAEIIECWQAKEGIHVKARVSSNLDQVNDISGTIEVMDPNGVSLGRTGVYIDDAFPGDVVDAQGFVFNVYPEGEYTCNFVLFEVIPPAEMTTSTYYPED